MTWSSSTVHLDIPYPILKSHGENKTARFSTNLQWMLICNTQIGILQTPEPFLTMEVAATILTILFLLLIIFLGVTLLWKPSPCLKSLSGKHVLITGGSSGIGLAIAKEALSQGAFVTLIARSSAKLKKAIDKLVDNKTISADRIC